MINVRVLFFGATADSVGKKEIKMALDEDVNAGKALDFIYSNVSGLFKNHNKKSLHFSINQEYSTGSEIISDGDELAIFTAVSGG